MNLFMYLNVKSFLHTLDPRTKMLIVLYFMATALMFVIPWYQLCLLVITLCYCAIGKSLSNVWRMRFVFLSIFVVTLIIWVLSIHTGEKLYLFITADGVNKGLSAGMGLIIIILSSVAFVSSTKIEELSAGLLKMGIPYKGAFALSTAIRMVPMIVSTGYTILQAQKSRGLDVDSGNIYQRIKKYLPLMIPAIVTTIRGTNVFAMALESKGFGYSEKRTSYIQVKYRTRDYIITIFAILFFIIAVFIKLYYKV
jgi:energy-coupling factor transport system permease protein